MSTATDKDLKELKAEYASLKSDLADMSDTLSSLARDGVSEGREKVRGAARQSRKQAREAWSAVEDEFEDRPVTSLAVALGIGFILGKVLSR